MAALSLNHVIKVENIPWSANAFDVRKFFSGLSIPEGGVHIFGGDKGIAFVGFQTEEDLNKAINLNGTIFNNAQVNVLPSGRAEISETLEKLRSGKFNVAAQLFPQAARVPLLAQSRVPYPASFRESEKQRLQAVATRQIQDSIPLKQPLQNQMAIETVQPSIPIVYEAETERTSMIAEEAPKPMPAMNDIRPCDWFIELRNLPKDATSSHINTFLFDCKPATEDDIVIVPWMGRALVHLFGLSFMRDRAIGKSGLVMTRGIPVDVVEVTINEFLMAKAAVREAAAQLAAAVVPPLIPNLVSTNAARSSPPPGITSAPPSLPAVTTEFIKLCGLPVQYQWHNIRALFPSARIAKDGLRLEKNTLGHFTGVAYLKFTNLEECSKALERLCSMKYEVHLLSRDEYERGVASADGRSSSADSNFNPNYRYVTVKNIEEGATAENVCGIFRGIDVSPANDVVFRPPGNVALVRLKSEHDQQTALRRNRSLLGVTTVIVEPASHADFEHAISQASFPQVGRPGCSIMFQNLNTDMDQKEVLALIEPFSPISDTLRMHYDENGRPTGRAIVAFSNPEAAQQASEQLNGKEISGNILSITVF